MQVATEKELDEAKRKYKEALYTGDADKIAMKAAAGIAIADDRDAWFSHNGSPSFAGVVACQMTPPNSTA